MLKEIFYSFIKDSDDEANNSEEQLEAEEDEEIVFLGLSSLLDSHYLELIFIMLLNLRHAPVELQLAIFLQRVGSKDEISGICSRFGISEGFNNVIGAIDGTNILLGTAPFKQPEIYRNHKKNYLIQCQGGSAYPLSTFLIKPFNNPENNLETQFNITHSLHCIVVEYAFGRFKNRFSSLKELNVRKISTTIHFTECRIIVYNFLETNNEVGMN
ncbi:hypothetical protein C1646_762237 [Rhizophagus diaphanus]|nr:hypothetical protein C1646_762237 [Rhizophagus diaphanus] [Rhizophagus sp. MUCL 43196]